MKCQKCGGTGKTYKASVDLYSRCDECRGTGTIMKTNEEWFNTLSTTEEKAEAIYECVMANSWSFNKNGIKRWLKQPHKEETR